MQQLTSDGLVPAQPEQRRCTVMPILNGNEALAESLIETWKYRNPQQAYSVLKSDDVTVTNMKDKAFFLPKILKLDEEG